MRRNPWIFLVFTLVSAAGQSPTASLTFVTNGLTHPTDIQDANDQTNRLFLVQQDGIIRIFKNGALLPTPFLNISGKTTGTGERGLLGLGFPPGFQTKQRFYINYTNLSGNTVIARYRVSSNPDVADAASETILLTIEQPYVNHNGGALRFSPRDGYLYIGMGDGGAGGDPEYRAQTPSVLLGKILRIDVESDLTQISAPASNPFVNNPAYSPFIWALGVRNPWRFSFDRQTGDVWIGDVGQDRAEEVDFQPASSPGGENYGWNPTEGFQCYVTNCLTGGITWPVLEYSHSEGCSVTGGSVYRGSAFPGFQGVYVYGDLCSGRLWGLRRSGSGWSNRVLLDTGKTISTFGEDQAGEIYLADYAAGEIFRLNFAGGWPPSSVPSVTSVAPSSGSGSSQTFMGQFSDVDGYPEIAWVQMLVATAPNGGGSPFCFVHYDRSANALWLYGDAGFFLGPVRPGVVSSLLRNSSCAVNTGATTFSVSGDSLALNLVVTFQSAMTGARNVYLRALDFAGNDTGFQQRGTWTVTMRPAPQLTVAPSAGSGSIQNFTGGFPDPPGFGGFPLGWVQMLFAVSPDGGGQPFCWVHYDRPANSMWLYGDSGFFLGPVTPGAASSLQNSFCSVNVASSTAVNSSGSLQWSMPVTFRTPAFGPRNIYLRQNDALGRDSGFLPAGGWSITQPPYQPVTHSVTPPSGSGLNQLFQSLYSDGDGFGNLAYVQVLVAGDVNASDGKQCYVHYDRAGNGLWLYGDAGFFLGPVTPGASSNLLRNSWCSVDSAGVSVSTAGTNLTLGLPLAFQPRFSGNRKVFLLAGDADGHNSGWQERGGWTVP